MNTFRRGCVRPFRRCGFLVLAFLFVTVGYLTFMSFKDIILSNVKRNGSHRALAYTYISSGLNRSEVKHHHHSWMKQQQACVHPDLDLWHPELAPYFKDVPPLQCNEDENWVYVDNGTFRISPSATRKYGKIICEYTPQLRHHDDFTVINGQQIKNIQDGTQIVSDFFIVRCASQNGKIYRNVHSAIAFDRELHERSTKTSKPPGGLGLDVLMFGFDSTSRMTWMRNLPKTHEYYTKELGGIVLEGYNIVGDGTPQALLPILTGKSEPELPEARRGHAHAKTVDGHPWIWKDFQKAGYVTQWGEDGPGMGTFTYRMLGFKDQPVDHYMRPYYIQLMKYNAINKNNCVGSIPRHTNMLNWIKDLYLMYGKKPKFTFLFHSDFTHGGYSEVRVADGDLRDFLKYMHEAGLLNNTLLILMADHGARFQAVRQTVQGKYEERMPYFSFRFPEWFEKKYPQAVANLQTNAHKLTTPYDVHETLRDVLLYKGSGKGNISQRGISLFKEIPLERTCENAGIEPHWCACLNWQQADPTSLDIRNAANSLVNKINSITESQRNKCEKLKVYNITAAASYAPHENLLKFKSSRDADGRFADLSDKMDVSEVLFQISVKTKPGYGQFEATVKYLIKEKQFEVNDKEISRINKYGDQPHCVAAELPHLRPYCYCKIQMS